MIDDSLLEAEEKMEKAVVVAKEEFSGIRTGRAHPSMFNKITAEYYGTQTPVNQLASFHLPEARMVVDPALRQGLDDRDREGDQELRPGRQPVERRLGHPRRVFPELSEERRKEYIKVARSKAEDSRVSIRNIRRHAKDSIDKLVKGGDAGEDDGRRAERELEELTHKYVAQVDELLKHKEAELLEV